MIDQLKFIEDLKQIKIYATHPKSHNKGIVDFIDGKIAIYQKEVDEFEKWAEEEAQKDSILEGTDIHDSSDSPFLAHPGVFSGEKSE